MAVLVHDPIQEAILQLAEKFRLPMKRVLPTG
jgi:hypothetical protein